MGWLLYDVDAVHRLEERDALSHRGDDHHRDEELHPERVAVPPAPAVEVCTTPLPISPRSSWCGRKEAREKLTAEGLREDGALKDQAEDKSNEADALMTSRRSSATIRPLQEKGRR